MRRQFSLLSARRETKALIELKVLDRCRAGVAKTRITKAGHLGDAPEAALIEGLRDFCQELGVT